MSLPVAPEQADAADGVDAHAVGVHFAKRNEPVDVLDIGRKKDIVRSAVLDLLGEGSAGPDYETKWGVGRIGFVFAESPGERLLKRGEVGSGGDGKLLSDGGGWQGEK